MTRTLRLCGCVPLAGDACPHSVHLVPPSGVTAVFGGDGRILWQPHALESLKNLEQQ